MAWLSLWTTIALTEEVDPASRVARVSYLKGEVYTQTVDNDDWADARINQPLTSGDQLWTDKRGRAELQMGGTTLRVDADTQLQLLELSDDVAQIQVTQGTVNVWVRNLTKRDTVEIDTPNAAISVMESGTDRIEVADHDDLTLVQVRTGSVDVAGEQQEYTVREDQQLVLRGRRDPAEFDDLGRMDEFDRWAADRNQRAGRVASSRYVGSDVIGYEDLDDYGYWRWYNDYGYVWMPTRIVSGWAPYRYGRWSWVSPWGWTWIDDAPWGFAPFHYGRWTTIGNRWCWVPGPRTVRAVYAPALVAWIGTPGLSVSVNIGTHPVGWIPLGPREIYRPVYRASHNYVVNVNISNSRLNHNDFERGYRRQPQEVGYLNRHAASVVRTDALRSMRPVRDQLLYSADRDLQPLTAPVARPERREQIGNQRTTPPVTANAREVLARRQPARPIANDSAGRPGGLRVIEPAVSRRDFGANGYGPEVSGNNQDRRSIDNTPEERAAPDLNSRPVASPQIRTERSRPDTDEVRRDPWQRGRNTTSSGQEGATPDVPARRETPAVTEPRVRNYSRVDEMRSSDRQEYRPMSPDAGPAPERSRSITVPEIRGRVQRDESAQSSPAPNAAPESRPDRSRNSESDNGRQRGIRGDSR